MNPKTLTPLQLARSFKRYAWLAVSNRKHTRICLVMALALARSCFGSLNGNPVNDGALGATTNSPNVYQGNFFDPQGNPITSGNAVTALAGIGVTNFVLTGDAYGQEQYSGPFCSFDGWPADGLAAATESYISNACWAASNNLFTVIYPNFCVQIDDGWQGVRAGGVFTANPTNFLNGSLSNICRIAHGFGCRLIAYTEPNATSSGGFPSTGTNIEADAITFANWGLDGVRFDITGVANHHDYDALRQLQRMVTSFRGAAPNRPSWFESYGWAITNLHLLASMPPGCSISGGGDPGFFLGGTYPYNVFTNLLADLAGDRWHALDFKAPKGKQIFGTYTVHTTPFVAINKSSITLCSLFNRPFNFVIIGQAPHNSGTDFIQNIQWVTNSEVAYIQQDLFAPPVLVQSNATSQVWCKKLSDSSTAVMLLNTLTNGSTSIGVNSTQLGFDPSTPLVFRDLWAHSDVAIGQQFGFTNSAITNMDCQLLRVSKVAAKTASTAFTTLNHLAFNNVLATTINIIESGANTGIPALNFQTTLTTSRAEIVAPSEAVTTTNIQMVVGVQSAATAGTIPIYMAFSTLKAGVLQYNTITTNYVFVAANAATFLTNNFIASANPDYAGAVVGVTVANTNFLQVMSVKFRAQ